MSDILIKPVLTLSLAKGVVYSLAFSPDGQRLAGSGGVLWSFFLGKENVIRIWDSRSGSLLYTLPGHSNFVSAVTFSLDGSTLISSSLDGTIKLWNTQTFQTQFTIDESSPTPWKFDGKPLRMSLPKIDSIVLHPNQRWLATGDISGCVTLWDIQSREKLIVIGEHEAFTSIALSPDGTLLATCDDHAGYNLFDVPSGRWIYPAPGAFVFGRLNGTNWATVAPQLKTITFSPDGKVLAGGCYRGTIRLWDIETGNEICKIKGSTAKGVKACISSLIFSRNGNYLISADSNGRISLWNLQTKQCMCTFEGHSREICSLALSPDGNTLVSSSLDRTVQFWRSSFLSK
jgi:WD40 repeat protein